MEKSFDEFAGIISADYRNIEKRALETEKSIHADQATRLLRASAEEAMEILRRYHEWANS